MSRVGPEELEQTSPWRPVCLLVFGRTLDEALKQARASISFRLRGTVERPEPAMTLAGESRDAFQTGLTAA